MPLWLSLPGHRCPVAGHRHVDGLQPFTGKFPSAAALQFKTHYKWNLSLTIWIVGKALKVIPLSFSANQSLQIWVQKTQKESKALFYSSWTCKRCLSLRPWEQAQAAQAWLCALGNNNFFWKWQSLGRNPVCNIYATPTWNLFWAVGTF